MKTIVRIAVPFLLFAPSLSLAHAVSLALATSTASTSEAHPQAVSPLLSAPLTASSTDAILVQIRALILARPHGLLGLGGTL